MAVRSIGWKLLHSLNNIERLWNVKGYPRSQPEILKKWKNRKLRPLGRLAWINLVMQNSSWRKTNTFVVSPSSKSQHRYLNPVSERSSNFYFTRGGVTTFANCDAARTVDGNRKPPTSIYFLQAETALLIVSTLFPYFPTTQLGAPGLKDSVSFCPHQNL